MRRTVDHGDRVEPRENKCKRRCINGALSESSVAGLSVKLFLSRLDPATTRNLQACRKEFTSAAKLQLMAVGVVEVDTVGSLARLRTAMPAFF